MDSILDYVYLQLLDVEACCMIWFIMIINTVTYMETRRKSMSRVSAREVLMKLLYERDIAGEHHNESFEKLSDEFQLDMNDEEYVKKILFSMDAEQGK